jgi:hypothetical protein
VRTGGATDAAGAGAVREPAGAQESSCLHALLHAVAQSISSGIEQTYPARFVAPYNASQVAGPETHTFKHDDNAAAHPPLGPRPWHQRRRRPSTPHSARAMFESRPKYRLTYPEPIEYGETTSISWWGTSGRLPRAALSRVMQVVRQPRDNKLQFGTVRGGINSGIEHHSVAHLHGEKR